jgi:hypothetical protein
MMDVLKNRWISACMEMKCTGLPQLAAVFQLAVGANAWISERQPGGEAELGFWTRSQHRHSHRQGQGQGPARSLQFAV